MICLITFYFSSSFYCKNRVYSTYKVQNVLMDCYVTGKASGQQELLVIKFFGESEVICGFLDCAGVGAPNPPVVQGSIVFLVQSLISSLHLLSM